MRGAIKVPWKEPATFPSGLEEAHGELVLMRLHALVAAGYRPVLGAEAGGAAQIELIHPSAHPLCLWPDGQVLDSSPTSIKNDADRTIIHPNDQAAFREFIASVSKPNIFHRIWRMSLADLAGYGVVYTLIIGFVLTVGHFVKKWFH